MSDEQIVTLDQEQAKLCNKCGEVRLLSEFSSNGKTRKKTYCKICANRYAKRRRDKLHEAGRHKEWKRKIRLRDYYGLTVEQFHAMEVAQGGVCAICGNPETASNKHGLLPLSVDHNHKTGNIRGLLCLVCNRKLVSVEDGHFLHLALSYLKKYDQ